MALGPVGKMNPFRKRTVPPERFRMADDTLLGNIATSDTGQEPAPIVSVSVGSTGMRRTALWRRKMDALGCAGRIQSVVAYDCNSTNVKQWIDSAKASNALTHCIVPEYLPFSEGFLRDPNFFIKHYGPIERDLENMVDQIDQKAAEAGVRPQLILEWIGFGGHARITYLLHEMLAERFQGAQFLPVYCIPDDRVLEKNIRDYRLWDEAQEIMGPVPSVITDNRTTGSLQALDERLATAIASSEACYRFRPEYGTLAEIAASFNINGNRWLGIQIMDIPYRENVNREKQRIVRPDEDGKQDIEIARENRAAITAQAQVIKEAIWTIANPRNDEYRTGYIGGGKHGDEQVIYVLMPFHPEIADLIKEDVEDQLQRETFNGPYPGTKVCFAAGNANYSKRPGGYAYGHICKIHGTKDPTPPVSVRRVLDPDNDYRGNHRRVLSRGESMMKELGIPMSTLESMTNNGNGDSDLGFGNRQMTGALDGARRAGLIPPSNEGQVEPEVPDHMGDGETPLLTEVDLPVGR